jgi:hypothetical protein
MYTYKYYVILNTTLHINGAMHIIDSPTKVKHHLICFNNIFSNNELISNRFAIDRFLFMCIWQGV